MFLVYVNFTLQLILSIYIYLFSYKKTTNYVSALSVVVAMTYLVYWLQYSDNSVLLEDPSIYLGPGAYSTPSVY